MNPHATEHWQRLSPWAVLLIIGSALTGIVRQNLGFLLGAGAGFVFIDWLGPRELLGGAAVLLLAVAVGAMIYHRRFRFRLEGDAIRLRRGLFERKELRIRFARVLNVHLSQPFYLRPLDLVRFSLDTAGAAEKEVELPGIPRVLAEQLRDRIAAVCKGSEQAEPAVAADALFAATDRDLLLHGLVSNQVWVLAGALLSVMAFLENRLVEWWMVAAVGQKLLQATIHPVVLVLALGGGLLLLLAVVSMLASWLRFGGFRLDRVEDDDEPRLVSRAGLLDRREQTVPLHKLHAFEQVQTALGRLLARWYLTGYQAGAVRGAETRRNDRFVVPGLDSAHLSRVRARVAPGTQDLPAMAQIERLYLRVMRLRLLLVVVPGTVLAAIVLPDSAITIGPGADFGWRLAPLGWWPVLVSGAGLLALGMVMLWARWRRWGYAHHDGRLWVRRGLIGQRIITFRLESVHQVQLRQSPAQHRNYSANVILVLPHGPVVVPFLPLDRARTLVNETLHRAETAAVHRI